MYTIQLDDYNKEFSTYKKKFYEFKLKNIEYLDVLKEYLKLEIEQTFHEITEDDYSKLKIFIELDLMEILVTSYPSGLEKFVFLQKEYMALYSSFFTFPHLVIEDSVYRLLQILEEEVAFNENLYKYYYYNDKFIDAINMELKDGYIDEYLEKFRLDFFSTNKAVSLKEFEVKMLLEKIDKYLLFEKYHNVYNKTVDELSMTEEQYLAYEKEHNPDYPDVLISTEILKNGNRIFYNDFNSWNTWYYIAKIIIDSQRLYFNITGTEFNFKNTHLNNLEINLDSINQNVYKEDLSVSHLYLFLYIAMRQKGKDFYLKGNKKNFETYIESLLDGNTIVDKDLSNVYHQLMTKYKIKKRVKFPDRLLNSQFNANYDREKFERLLFLMTEIDNEIPSDHSILDEIEKAKEQGVNNYFPK